MKLQYDESLSNFAFNFNSRRYIKDEDEDGSEDGLGASSSDEEEDNKEKYGKKEEADSDDEEEEEEGSDSDSGGAKRQRNAAGHTTREAPQMTAATRTSPRASVASAALTAAAAAAAAGNDFRDIKVIKAFKAVAAAAAADPGGVVQFDGIKPMLKAPGTKRLKLKSDQRLSILLQFGFKFHLRRYTQAATQHTPSSSPMTTRKTRTHPPWISATMISTRTTTTLTRSLARRPR